MLLTANQANQAKGAVDAAEEAGFVFAGEFVFPNPKDGPSGFAQGANDNEVAFFVGGKFAPPEGAIVDGQVGMFGAGVPETAVHKKREPHATEDEIRFAKTTLCALNISCDTKLK
jgi:hypothetical protein